jgi:peptidoglycan/LPS O-acetylase OafA/YrhL
VIAHCYRAPVSRENQDGRPQWPGLDGLRAVAVLLVIGYHADRALGNGYLGVDVFFVLSGFLITTLLLREVDGAGRIRIGAFYVRRVLRLYPALVVVCAAVSAAAVVLQDHPAKVGAGALASLGYVANVWEYSGHDTLLLQHTWTLALEEQFYLIWPALLALIVRRPRAVWLVVAGWLAVEVADGLAGQPPVLHTYIRAAGLPLGCGLAFALRHVGVQSWLARFGAPALVAIVVLAAVHADLGAWTAGWPLSIASVLTVPVIAALVADGPMTRLLSRPEFVWIGRRSYGLYLWHFPVLSAVINHAPARIPMPARLVAGVAASFVLAAASYRWVEEPFLRRKLRYEPRREKAAA